MRRFLHLLRRRKRRKELGAYPRLRVNGLRLRWTR
jgi:hypothetical protein